MVKNISCTGTSDGSGHCTQGWKLLCNSKVKSYFTNIKLMVSSETILSYMD